MSESRTTAALRDSSIESKCREVLRNNAAARQIYITAQRAGMSEAQCLRAVIVQLAELNQRAMTIIADAIMHGMPITAEVAAVRNQLVMASSMPAETTL